MTTCETAARLQVVRLKYARLAVALLAQAADQPGMPLDARLGAVHELDIQNAVERVRAYKRRRAGCTWAEAVAKIIP